MSTEPRKPFRPTSLKGYKNTRLQTPKDSDEPLAATATLGMGRLVCRPHLARYTAAIPDRITGGACPLANRRLRLTPRRNGLADCAWSAGGSGALAPARSAARGVAGTDQVLQSALDLFQMLLAQIEGVRLAAKAEGKRFRGADVSLFEVTSHDLYGAAGQLKSPFASSPRRRRGAIRRL